DPSRLDLDGSERSSRIASCARTARQSTLHVKATSPDLSLLHPIGFHGVEIDLQVADPAAALATLPPLDSTTRLDLACTPGQRIGAAQALEKVGNSPGIGGTCLSFDLRRGDWFGKTRWTIQLRSGISGDDFDVLVGFARTRATRFTLDAASTARAEVLADLAL